MSITDHEREIMAKLREIKSNSPSVEFSPAEIPEYLAIVEERIGTVSEYYRAGYILPNGKLTDASIDNIFDNNDRILTHKDVMFYGFKEIDLSHAGIMKYGVCPANEIPFVEISLRYTFPTSEQFDVLDDILSKSPNILDVEAKLVDEIDNKVERAFYKRYDFANSGDSAKIIKQDLQRYKNGDKTYCGCYDEVWGEVMRP